MTAADPAALPGGTVTFLFTDLEGSTRLWEEFPEAMGDALARHDDILRNAVARHDGTIVKTTGDGIHAVFTSARQALDAALDAQQALQAAEWGITGPLRVRMGLHTGEAERRGGDYYGTAVNRAARITACGHGGQILVSQTTAQLLEDSLPDGTVLVDLGSHQLRDLARPEHLFQVQHPGLLHDFPPLRTLDAYPTNLPAQRTSFVGRDADVDAVARALRDARLVTITGVGGVGKSRLAIQVAAAVLPRFPDGAWLCELAPVTDPAAVPDVVAAAVGVPPGSGPVREALRWHLRDKHALLLFDNCEHVLDAVVDTVDDLLAHCPQVSVLATSREALGVPGEHTFGLRTLPTPSGTDVGAVMASPAGRLFVDRAQAARHDFTLDDTNAAAVAELCVHLDGIPLAIELAAARVRSLTPAEIVDRLDERFRLLSGGIKGRGRHQTLRAALAWSTDLLEPRERDAFARLAVFVAPFDLAAAEAVVGGDAWELLDALVEKSLLLAEDSAGSMRYRMLETVREFAAELLLASGDVADARTRHAHHFVEVAEAAAASGSVDEIATLTRRDGPNLSAALAWLAAERDVDRALRLATAFDRGYLDVASARFYEMALAIPGALDHPLAPQAMASAANRAIARGELPERAYAQAKASLDLAAELGVTITGVHRINLAAACMRSGHLDEARAAARAAVDEFGDDPLLAARAYAVLAAVEQWSGDLQAAEAAAEASEAAARRAGQPIEIAQGLLLRGYVCQARDPDAALLLLDEAARIAFEHLPGAVSVAIYSLAQAARIRGQHGDATGMARDLAEALRLAANEGSREEYANVLAGTAVSLLTVGRPEDAALLLAAAEQIFAAPVLYAAVGVDGHALAATLVEALGPTGYEEARARGAAMSDRDVRAFALTLLDEIAAGH